MNRRNARVFIGIGLLIFVTACAGGISQQARSQVTYHGAFASVQQAPASHEGGIVMWGGKVIETVNRSESTELTVLQQELGRNGYPRGDDQSKGRFLVRSTQFMDPALYPEGTSITVVGRMEGSETRLIGEMPYVYPVISIVEIKKWPPGGDPSPKIHFGIGIGAHF